MQSSLNANRLDLPIVSVSCPFGHQQPGQLVGRGQDDEYGTSDQWWTFVRCPVCSHYYLSPRPAIESLSVIYPSTYYAYEESVGRSRVTRFFRSWFEARKAATYLANLPPGPRRLLDVGCGDGRFLAALAGQAPSEFHISGIDVDERAITQARAVGHDVAAAQLEQYAPEFLFDAIFLFQVIEHMADPQLTIKHIKRLLAPSGIVIIETPDVAGLDFHLFKNGLWGGYHFPRHWHLFSPATLRRLCVDAGFTVVTTGHSISPAFWIHSLHHLAKRLGAPLWLLKRLHVWNPFLLLCVIPLDLLCLVFRLPTSNQILIARKPA